jgi:hypothetical protein
MERTKEDHRRWCDAGCPVPGIKAPSERVLASKGKPARYKATFYDHCDPKVRERISVAMAKIDRNPHKDPVWKMIDYRALPTAALQEAEESGGPEGEEYYILMESVARLAMERAHTARVNGYGGPKINREDPSTIKAGQVIAMLAALGIRADWEFPGYIRVLVPGGNALAYGTANADWSGSFDTDEDGHIPPGWEPRTLPLDASAEDIAAVLIDGYRAQIAGVAFDVLESLVDMHSIAEREAMETSYGKRYDEVVSAARSVAKILAMGKS